MGKMGGGLSFLNKKPWHPGSIKNIEKTIKCKIADEINKKKSIERIKELKKDRELEELLRTTGSVKHRNVSLDWMYSGGSTANLTSSSTKTPSEKTDNNVVNRNRILTQQKFEKNSNDTNKR